jgi:hypothetical protein
LLQGVMAHTVIVSARMSKCVRLRLTRTHLRPPRNLVEALGCGSALLLTTAARRKSESAHVTCQCPTCPLTAGTFCLPISDWEMLAQLPSFIGDDLHQDHLV